MQAKDSIISLLLVLCMRSSRDEETLRAAAGVKIPGSTGSNKSPTGVYPMRYTHDPGVASEE
eukprot:scaffold237774_cov22-Tisochrysis_lutea.AAC.1